MSDTKYMISKEDCEKTINGVCPGCGGTLAAIETVDNAGRPTYWVGCEHCGVYTNGVPIEYYKIARAIVDKDIIIPYSHMHKCDYSESTDRLDYWTCSQTKGLAQVVAFVSKELRSFSDAHIAKDRSENEALRKRIADLEKELSTPILVNTARLADQLSKERERSARMVKAISMAVNQFQNHTINEALAKYQEEGE
jgi:hypothetical protein